MYKKLNGIYQKLKSFFMSKVKLGGNSNLSFLNRLMRTLLGSSLLLIGIPLLIISFPVAAISVFLLIVSVFLCLFGFLILESLFH